MNKEKYEYWDKQRKNAEGEYKKFCIKQKKLAEVEE
jgi:hypothetical protein